MNIEIMSKTIAVVTELPQHTVLKQFKSISEELFRANFEGKVVFDLLISKGTSSRFVEADFDGRSIVRSSLKVAITRDIPLEIIHRQSMFFATNSSLLGTSMLSSKEIESLTLIG
ncbi:MAG: hypothetical protein ACJAS1_003348 [Oleiphilaceae bacterium]|jgi:hypothetical protein